VNTAKIRGRYIGHLTLHNNQSMNNLVNISFVKTRIITGWSLTCGKYLHDILILLRWDVWGYSLTPLLFIEVPVPSQKSEWSCISVLGLSFLPLYTVLIFDFAIVLTMWYYFSFYYTIMICLTLIKQSVFVHILHGLTPHCTTIYWPSWSWSYGS
jgi:hypothetical protein